MLSLYPYFGPPLYYIPTYPLYTTFFLLYLKILYREIHAIWLLTLTSRETYLNERSKKQITIFIYNTTIHFEFKKLAKKIYEKTHIKT